MTTSDLSPIYLRLRDELAEKIGSGELMPGDRLPSERVLSTESGAARMTVREALRMLEGDGLIYRKERSGYFVSAPRLRYDPIHHVNTMRLIPSQGHDVGRVILPGERIRASGPLVRQMGCRKGTKLIRQCGIALMNKRRVCYEQTHLLDKAFPKFLERPYESPLTDFLARQYNFRGVQVGFSVRSINLYGPPADHLEVRHGTPGIFVTRYKSSTKNGPIWQLDHEYWLGGVLEIVIGRVESAGVA